MHYNYNKKFDYEYVSFEELYTAYQDCLKRKRNTVNAIEFLIDEEEKLSKLYYELNSKTYEVGKSITFIVDRPVHREVFAADFRDRIVHHLIINRTLQYFEEEFDDDSYSCRKGMGTEYGIRRCYQQMQEVSNNFKDEAYVIKCDLKSFFMTINKDALYNKLCKMLDFKFQGSDIDREYTKYLIKLVVYDNPHKKCIFRSPKSKWNLLPKSKSLFNTDDKHGLPIGNLTSQIFANFYLNEFDRFVRNELGCKYYGRYVDDFYIVTKNKDKIGNILSKCREKLASLGVTLHPNKVYVQEIHKGLNFIGSTIKPNRIYIGKRTHSRFKEVMRHHYEWLQNILSNDKKPTNYDIAYFVASINAYLGFMKHRKSYNIRKKLLSSHLILPWLKYVYFDNKLNKITAYQDYTLYSRKDKPNYSIENEHNMRLMLDGLRKRN